MAADDVPDLRCLHRAVLAAKGGHFGGVRVRGSSVPTPAAASLLRSQGLLSRLRRR